MPDDLREQLLASYADLGEAMVIQNLLEVEGIACRVEDLGGVPDHVLGIAGGFRRSVALFVLDRDVERATSLLAALALPENAVDEEALAAEAEAAAAVPSSEPGPTQDGASNHARSPSREMTRSRSLAGMIVAALVVLLALLIVRGLR